VAAPLADVLELTNIVMLFLLAVVGVALRYGRGPAVLAAFLGVGLFDFFFVPPRFSFAVSDVQYVLTFSVMLTVALVIGQMTAGLKYQASVAIEREGRVRALYQLSRDLSGALLPEQVAEFSARFLAGEFGARSGLLPADAAGWRRRCRRTTCRATSTPAWRNGASTMPGRPAGAPTPCRPAPCCTCPCRRPCAPAACWRCRPTPPR
jgi:K+-sensing histidine kinase KdpD